MMMEEPRKETEIDDLAVLLDTGTDEELKEFLRVLHPADIADLVEQLDEGQRSRVFSLLPDRVGADVLPEIEDHVLEEVIGGLSDDQLTGFVYEMDSDDAADLLAELPRKQRRQILARIEPADSEEIRRLMGYSPETAGGLMQTELIAVLETATVGEVIDEVRARRDEVEDVHFVFVVDDGKRLRGQLELRDLLLADTDQVVSEIMDRDVIKVGVETDQEKLASIMMKYNMVSLPVVDVGDRLLGRIWVDDVMDALEDEVDEDFLLMAGAGEEELEDFSVAKSVYARLPWLAITWMGGITTALIMGHFSESMAAKMIPLAAFIPIIMAMGGNVGTQSATIIVRGIATGRVDYSRVSRFFLGQVLVGSILGVLIGVLTSAFVSFRPNFQEYALVIGGAMVAVMTFSAFVGTILPVFFKRVGVDPAIATAPIISMFCDILGIIIYLSLAAWLLS